MYSNTVAELYAGLNIPFTPGSKGSKNQFFRASRGEVLTWQVPPKIQRKLSPSNLKSMGILDWNLLIPVIVSDRPQSLEEWGGRQLLDGQHEAMLFIGSQEEDDLPYMLIEHSPDATLNEVLRKEAQIFKKLNTQRKNLTTLDVLRAEYVYDEPFALHIHAVMTALNLAADRFGSEDVNAKDIEAFNHFYYTVKNDNEATPIGIARLQSAYRLYERIYPRAQKVHGTAFRAIAFLDRFINDGLANGKQSTFKQWCIDSIQREWTPKSLVKGYSSFNCHRWILYRIIDKYNREQSNLKGKGAQTIGQATLVSAAQRNEKFKHPDHDEWTARTTGLTTIK